MAPLDLMSAGSIGNDIDFPPAQIPPSTSTQSAVSVPGCYLSTPVMNAAEPPAAAIAAASRAADDAIKHEIDINSHNCHTDGDGVTHVAGQEHQLQGQQVQRQHLQPQSQPNLQHQQAFDQISPQLAYYGCVYGDEEMKYGFPGTSKNKLRRFNLQSL